MPTSVLAGAVATGSRDERGGKEKLMADSETHIVVLGAGFGGLEFVTRLSDAVSEKVRVTLIDKSDAFMFGFSKLDVMFGREQISNVWHPYQGIRKPGVDFHQETVLSIDPSRRQVVTDRGTYDPDILVVALGADYDTAATPGLDEDGYEFYSHAGAERARDALQGFGGGAVVIAVLGGFFKCPGAPNETALLLHDYLVAPRAPGHVDHPPGEPAAHADPDIQEDLRRHRSHPRGPRRRILAVIDGHSPRSGPPRGPPQRWARAAVRFVPGYSRPSGTRSRIGLRVGGRRVDSRRSRHLRHRILGGLCGWRRHQRTGARAGGIAEGEAATVAEVLIARLNGAPPPPPYGGAAGCYIELGDDLVGRIDVNFLEYDTPVARFLAPEAALTGEKKEWGATRASRWFG